jgi:hypothetical protein
MVYEAIKTAGGLVGCEMKFLLFTRNNIKKTTQKHSFLEIICTLTWPAVAFRYKSALKSPKEHFSSVEFHPDGLSKTKPG